MAGIFLSYRREDAGGHAGRLYDALAQRFGASAVFRDIDTMKPGVDFVESIEASVAAADVVIAVIGQDWLTAVDSRGNRRLEQAHDYVRLELELALQREVRLIPVLVRHAEMPRPEELPNGLASLTRRNAFELPDRYWPVAIEVLMRALEEILGKQMKGARVGPSIGAEVTVPTETKEEEWPRELIEEQYRESPDSMKQFQQFLAAYAGQEFSTPELAEALGAQYGWKTIAGTLGAYSRRVKNRYERSSFPFQQRWDYNSGMTYHSMTPEVAEVIKSLD